MYFVIIHERPCTIPKATHTPSFFLLSLSLSHALEVKGCTERAGHTQHTRPLLLANVLRRKSVFQAKKPTKHTSEDSLRFADTLAKYGNHSFQGTNFARGIKTGLTHDVKEKSQRRKERKKERKKRE